MKKIYILIGLVFISMFFISCTNVFTTAATTTNDASVATTIPGVTTTRATTIATIDKDMVISDVYQMIYEDLYDEVKAEVMSSIS